MPGSRTPADSATAPPITTCSGLIRLAIEAMTRAIRSEIRSRISSAAGSPAAASSKTRRALTVPPVVPPAGGTPPAADHCLARLAMPSLEPTPSTMSR